MLYKNLLQGCRASFPWQFIIVFSILTAIIAYGYPLLNFSLNIDGEFRNNLEQTISYGRWGHTLLRAFFLPEPFVPYFTFLLALIFTAFTAVLLAWILELNKYQSLCFCALYITFPQFSYQFEFINQAETFAFGQLLSAVSVVFFCLACDKESTTKNKFLQYFLSIVAYSFAIGIYQTLVLVPPVILLARLLFLTLRDLISVATALKYLLSYFLVSLTALLVYLIIARVTQSLFQVDGSSYLLNFSQLDVGSLSGYLESLLANLLTVLTGSQNYGFATFLLACIVVSLCLLVGAWRRSIKIFWQGCLALAILVLPLLPLVFSQYLLPPRTFVVANLSLAVLLTYAFTFVLNLIRKEVALGIVAVLSVIHVAFITQLFYSDTLARQADILMANRIMTTITWQYPDFNEETTPVYFHGGYHHPHLYKLPNSDVFGSSFFAWDGGNNLRLEKFFHYYGVGRFRYADKNEVLGVLTHVEALPTWPHPDAVVYREGVMIVKLSEQRGWLPFELD